MEEDRGTPAIRQPGRPREPALMICVCVNTCGQETLSFIGKRDTVLPNTCSKALNKPTKNVVEKTPVNKKRNGNKKRSMKTLKVGTTAAIPCF